MPRRGTVHPVWGKVTDREQKRQDQIHENQIQSPWYNDYKAAEVREGVSTRHFVMLNRPFDVYTRVEVCSYEQRSAFRDLTVCQLPCQGLTVGHSSSSSRTTISPPKVEMQWIRQRSFLCMSSDDEVCEVYSRMSFIHHTGMMIDEALQIYSKGSSAVQRSGRGTSVSKRQGSAPSTKDSRHPKKPHGERREICAVGRLE
jgi:hypothetical protein